MFNMSVWTGYLSRLTLWTTLPLKTPDSYAILITTYVAATKKGKTVSPIHSVPIHFLWMQILLQDIKSIDEVSPCLQNYLKRYNDEFSGEGLDLMISSHVMFHVVRLHRILSYKNRLTCSPHKPSLKFFETGLLCCNRDILHMMFLTVYHGNYS